MAGPWKLSGLTILAPTPASIDFKRDRVDYWVSKGAQMSERVGKLYSKPPVAPAVPAA